jgi:hypothetical protein
MSTHETTKLTRSDLQIDVTTWDDNGNGILYVTTGAMTMFADVTPHQARRLAAQFAELAERIEKVAA